MDRRSELQSPDTRQYAAASTGTGKSHIAIAISANCVRNGTPVRFFTAIDLVNQLEAEARVRHCGDSDAYCRAPTQPENGYSLADRRGAADHDRRELDVPTQSALT
jgi:hypothetical protein